MTACDGMIHAVSETLKDSTRTPLPPTDEAGIMKVFDILKEAREAWQSQTKQQRPTRTPKIFIAARWSIGLSVVLFSGAIVLLALEQGLLSIALLVTSGLIALFWIGVGGVVFAVDIKRVSKGTESFDASTRHTRDINALASELSKCTLPALRIVRRSRNREYEATGVLISFFAPANFQTFLTQVVAIVALITSVVGLFLGKEKHLLQTLRQKTHTSGFLGSPSLEG
ncbi:MAG: hypothetical protein HC933_08450 [Pleurocapsa sp. SU_196_0]|nr:hypothetical protein [Pleurocapsa sp. SU_196_0]